MLFFWVNYSLSQFDLEGKLHCVGVRSGIAEFQIVSCLSERMEDRLLQNETEL